jgi:guanylate kinase
MNKVENFYFKNIPDLVQNISRELKQRKTALLIIVDGLSGSGKDYLIDESIKVLEEYSDLKVVKSKSKKSTRPPRKDELEKNSRSGTNILTEQEFKKSNNLFEYKSPNNKYYYGGDFAKFKNELEENQIVFLPIGELSKINNELGDANAYSNFAKIYNKLKKEFPKIKFINFSIKRDSVDNVAALKNRTESSAEEIKDRVRQIEFNPTDKVYRQVLINKGFIEEITNYRGKAEEGCEVYNILLQIEDKL